MSRMSSDPWFGQLEPAQQRRILSAAVTISLRSNESVFRRGDAPSGFYCVVSGTLKASTLREDGQEAILAVLEAGNWFGEASATDDMPRMHDVTAVASSKVLLVPQTRLRELMKQSDFVRDLMRLQSMHTRTFYALIEDSTLRSTTARVARRLLRLACGDLSPRSQERHTISITHEMLAMMLGVTRQTLSLELRTLASLGAISLGYGRITIESMDKLRSIDPDW